MSERPLRPASWAKPARPTVTTMPFHGTTTYSLICLVTGQHYEGPWWTWKEDGQVVFIHGEYGRVVPIQAVLWADPDRSQSVTEEEREVTK